jgi:hypothetical protein
MDVGWAPTKSSGSQELLDDLVETAQASQRRVSFRGRQQQHVLLTSLRKLTSSVNQQWF